MALAFTFTQNSSENPFRKRLHSKVNLWMVVTFIFLSQAGNLLFAGCGDYVIFTGVIPEHLQMSEQETSLLTPDTVGNRESQRIYPFGVDFHWKKCDGPNCGGEEERDSFQTKTLIAQNEYRIEVPCEKSSPISSDESIDSLPNSDALFWESSHSGRLDRPPQSR